VINKVNLDQLVKENCTAAKSACYKTILNYMYRRENRNGKLALIGNYRL